MFDDVERGIGSIRLMSAIPGSIGQKIVVDKPRPKTWGGPDAPRRHSVGLQRYRQQFKGNSHVGKGHRT